MRGPEVLIALQAGEQIKTWHIRNRIFKLEDGKTWAYTLVRDSQLRNGDPMAFLGWQEYLFPVSHLFKYEWVVVSAEERR